MFESVDARTNIRTNGRQLESNPISSPRAFGSGKLIKQPFLPQQDGIKTREDTKD